MTDIKTLRTKLEQLDAQKLKIKKLLIKSDRKTSTSRKIELGVHLLKIAEMDTAVHSALVKVWAVAKAKRPNVFIDVELPAAPKTIKFNSDNPK